MGVDKLYIDKNKLHQLMEEKCQGNYHAFARELGVNVAHLYRFFNVPESKAGPKLLGAVAKFCKKNNLDFMSFIFLD